MRSSEAQWVSVGQCIFPISNAVRQGCVLAPTLFSSFFSIMLREAKNGLPDGIYIRFRTDGSLFNLRRLLARTKTIEELITEPLFAEDCALLAHTEETLQHIVNRFSDAATNFNLTISLKKTEVSYQPPQQDAYSPPHISIDARDLFLANFYSSGPFTCIFPKTSPEFFLCWLWLTPVHACANK